MGAPAAALPRVHPTVVHLLADAAERAGDACALVCDGRRLSYAQYARCVAGFAAELVGLGARDSRVALVCGNSLDLAIAMFAVHAAGAQAVPINPGYTARELAHIFADAQPHVIVHDPEVAATVAPLGASLGIEHRVMVAGGADRSGAGRRLDAWRDDATLSLSQPPAPETLATLQYTGGTTGPPKGVNITHAQMSINIAQREAALPTRADDERIVCVMPLFHVFAVAMGLHLAAYCRGTLVIHRRYQPDALLAAIEHERITRLPAGPTVFIGLLGQPRFAQTDFSSLRCAYSGSAPLPEDTIRRWREATGTPILEGFGQSEAGPVLTYTREGAVPKPGSVGPPLPLTELQIVDVEAGTRVLPAGEPGEIRARGPQIMSGYRNRPQDTAQALRDGWLYTGDIGLLDADGDLWIRDRKKDMAIVGGYNVYPREVDEVLFAHPAVKEAATAGVPDAYYGETVRALVVLQPGASATVDELLAHCRANLARYKVPSRLTIVEALPRTPVGKIDRAALRQALSA